MHRSLVFLLVLLTSVAATLVFIGFHEAKEPESSPTTNWDYPEEESSNANSSHSDIASQDGHGQSSHFQDRAEVDENIDSSGIEAGPLTQAQPRGFHEVALSEQEKANLLQAPSVFLNRKPSEVLAKAMELGRVDDVRADRDFDENEYVTQGWIYYEPIDGRVPVVLCLSQTRAIVDWMYCQEETRQQSP